MSTPRSPHTLSAPSARWNSRSGSTTSGAASSKGAWPDLQPRHLREGDRRRLGVRGSPLLAANTEGTLTEPRRLWAAVDRPNLMIKVPGTREGLAVVQLIGEGINVNVTLLFALEAYDQAAEALAR